MSLSLKIFVCKFVKHFVLLGDVFDFCLGNSSYFRDKYCEIGNALSSVAKRGIRV